MEKINIAELLKDCPNGMELDCTMYDDLVFVEVDLEAKDYPITTRLTNGTQRWFTSDGRYELTNDAKCVIFPKGKTTWEGFVPPCKFKNGDIVSTANGLYIFILNGEASNDENCYYGKIYFGYCTDNNETINNNVLWNFSRLATEEEKQKLFDVIKENGYSWNPKTKALEKLPKSYKEETMNKAAFDGNTQCCDIMNSLIKEKASGKFDIATLVPFESKVLVRDDDVEIWIPAIWGIYDDEYGINYPYLTIGGNFAQCIPYEGNEHLLGTNNECNKYYKTWK